MTDTQKENLEAKYPNLANMTGAERDQIILNQLEIIANELVRVRKLTEKIQDRL